MQREVAWARVFINNTQLGFTRARTIPRSGAVRALSLVSALCPFPYEHRGQPFVARWKTMRDFTGYKPVRECSGICHPSRRISKPNRAVRASTCRLTEASGERHSPARCTICRFRSNPALVRSRWGTVWPDTGQPASCTCWPRSPAALRSPARGCARVLRRV